MRADSTTGRVVKWIEARSTDASRWAEQKHATSTGLTKRVSGALLDAQAYVATGRTFSEVRGASGDIRVTASRCLGVVGATVAVGSLASIPGYFVALAGTALFAGIAATAYLIGDRGLMVASKRMTAMTALVLLPVVGVGFSALIITTEAAALRRGNHA